MLGIVSSSHSQDLIKVLHRQNDSPSTLPEINNHRDILSSANISEIDTIFQKTRADDEAELDAASSQSSSNSHL
eukprot:15365762-Ditylum_brightwellii.AAC.1